jgi:hypothetical protein
MPGGDSSAREIVARTIGMAHYRLSELDARICLDILAGLCVGVNQVYDNLQPLSN